MEAKIKDAEAIITHAYYITREQLDSSNHKKLPDDFHDNLTAFLLQSFPEWGYEATKILVTASERYVRKAVFLESYSGAIYSKFQTFVEGKGARKNGLEPKN